MASGKKPDITTGNGTSQTPILAEEKDPTAVPSKPSPKAASIASKSTSKGTGSTKPRTMAEAMSLLQTDFFDLQSFGCKIVILAKDNGLYLLIRHPEEEIGFDTGKGHMTLGGVPVSKAGKK